MFRKTSLSDELFLLFFFERTESDHVFNYLHDSNSIFRAGRINSEWVFGLHSTFMFMFMFVLVTYKDLSGDFLMCIHFQHRSTGTVHTLMN